MNFLSRRLVLPEDLNYAGTLFGGRVLEWIDEECSIYAISNLETTSVVTKHMGAINFEAPAMPGDIVEFGLTTKSVGKTSITFTCIVRNKRTKKTICLADDIVFLSVDVDSRMPKPHGKSMDILHDAG